MKSTLYSCQYVLRATAVKVMSKKCGIVWVRFKYSFPNTALSTSLCYFPNVGVIHALRFE
jgi:hypothetical protein